jgi:hypothetical protein
VQIRLADHTRSITALLILHNNHSFVFVIILQHHFDDLVVGGLNVFSNVVGLYWKLTVTAIDQYSKFHTTWSAEIDQFIHRRSNGASGVQNIIHQHDCAVGNIRWDIGLIYDGSRTNRRQIISIKGDIELSGWGSNTFKVFDLVRDSFGKRDAAPPNANQQQVRGTNIPLDDFGSQPRQRSVYSGGIHYLGFQLHFERLKIAQNIPRGLVVLKLVIGHSEWKSAG